MSDLLRNIPQKDCVFPTAGDDKLAVRRERHRDYEISMPEHTTKRFAGGVAHSLAVPSEDALAISSPSSETIELIGPECARSGNPSWALVGALQE